MFRVLNFRSNRLRTKRMKFGPHKNFSLYGNHFNPTNSNAGICYYVLEYDHLGENERG